MVLMGPVSISGMDMVRGIITVHITDIEPAITDRTALIITVHMAIQAIDITIKNGTIDGGIIPGATIEGPGVTDTPVTITDIIGNIAVIAAITVIIIEIGEP